MKNLLVLCASSLFLAVVVTPDSVQAAPMVTDEAEGPSLSMSVTKLDFGRLAKGRSATRQVDLTNVGDAPLKIRRVGVNCGCAGLRLSTPSRLNVPIDTKDEGKTKLALAPGETATLTVTVDSAKLEVGTTTKRCLVYSNDREQSPIHLPISMTVESVQQSQPTPPVRGPVAPVALEPDRAEHHFGEVLRGEKATCEFELTNSSDEPLPISYVRNSCSCTASKMTIGETVLEGKELTEARGIGTLGPGESAKLEVTLETGSITAKGRGSSTLRKSIRVYCGETQPMQSLGLSISAEVTDPVYFEPNSLRFGRVRRSAGAKMTTVMKPNRIDGYRITEVTSPNPDHMTVSFKEIAGGEQPEYEITAELKAGAGMGTIGGSVLVSLDHDRVKELAVPVYVDVGPDVVFQGNDRTGAERLDFGILTGEEDQTLELVIENFDPAIPYVPENVELTARPTPDPFAYEIIEEQAGQRYKIKVTVSKDLSARYFSGKLRIFSQHPDVPVKMVDFRGWLKRSTPEEPTAAAGSAENR